MTGISWQAADAAIKTWITGALRDVGKLQFFQSLIAYKSQQRVDGWPSIVVHKARKVPENAGDENYTNSPNAVAGSEVTQTLRQTFVLHLQIRALADQDNAAGDLAPDALLEQILLSLRADDVTGPHGILSLAGLGLREPLGDIDCDPDIASPVWQPQAVVEVAFGYAVTKTKRLGYVTGVSHASSSILEPGRPSLLVPTV